jgi:hypothetical protein
LQQLGWTEGRNIRIDTRWSPATNDVQVRNNAAELVALAPDVILASAARPAAALQQATRTVPIGATKDPMQQAVRDALIAFMAATAQAEAEATKLLSGPVWSMRSNTVTERTLGASRAIRALSSTMCEPCWARRPWGSRRSPPRQG